MQRRNAGGCITAVMLGVRLCDRSPCELSRVECVQRLRRLCGPVHLVLRDLGALSAECGAVGWRPGWGLIDAVYYCGNATGPVWRAAASVASMAVVPGDVACDLPWAGGVLSPDGVCSVARMAQARLSARRYGPCCVRAVHYCGNAARPAGRMSAERCA